MKKEIEIKVCLSNAEEFISALEQKATRVSEKSQKDTYYTMPGNNFFHESPVYRYLRVRENGKTGSLDYHICNLDENNKLLWTDEYECQILDPGMMHTIFKQLGFVECVKVDKYRTVFKMDHFTITVDKITDLGVFAEVEFVQEEELNKEEAEAIKFKCFDCLEKLGASWLPAPGLGYPDMLLQKEDEDSANIKS